MRRAYTMADLLKMKPKGQSLGKEWDAAIGIPELRGTWFVYGPPKNGKTSFAMKLAKVLAQYKRIAYDSVEEGLTATFRMATTRANMLQEQGRFVVLDREYYDDLAERLKHRRYDVIFIDSVQFMELKFEQYKKLKARYPDRLFVYISHVRGIFPDGQTARKIMRDADVVFKIAGFKAFPTSRYGGGSELVISEEKAKEFYLS